MLCRRGLRDGLKLLNLLTLTTGFKRNKELLLINHSITSLYICSWLHPYHPEFQPIELVWAEIKQYVRDCFHIDRGVKLVSVLSPLIFVRIWVSLRFVRSQFHGDDFDFLSYYLTDDTIDINKIHLNAGDNIFDLDFHSSVVLNDAPHWSSTTRPFPFLIIQLSVLALWVILSPSLKGVFTLKIW